MRHPILVFALFNQRNEIQIAYSLYPHEENFDKDFLVISCMTNAYLHYLVAFSDFSLCQKYFAMNILCPCSIC